MLPQIINILINCSNIQFRKENVTSKFKKLNHFEMMPNLITIKTTKMICYQH